MQPPEHPPLVVELIGRDADTSVLAVSGELSLRSAGLIRRPLLKALADTGRVLVDVSALQLTWVPAIQTFPSVLADAGGWPGARLGLYGADAQLAGTLTALRVAMAVPLASDEAAARRLLDRRPPVVARRLPLDQAPRQTERARLFVAAACADWQLDPIRHDAVAVASELVDNAVVHTCTADRLTLRYRTHGLTIAVYDGSPDPAPRPQPIAESWRGRGLFVVAALSLRWGVRRDRNEKCIWAFLPATPPITYSGTLWKAAQDAAWIVPAHGTNSPHAATAARQLVPWLLEQHGPTRVQDVADELVVELADAATATVPQDPHDRPPAGDTSPDNEQPA